MDPGTSAMVMIAGVSMVAFLYASVGHGGASGYLAAMTLMSFSPSVMKPGALFLNLVVAGLASIQYIRAGHFRGRLLWPFALSSIPLAYVGARLALSPRAYALLLGSALSWAALRLAMPEAKTPSAPVRGLPSQPWTLAIGAVLGLVSGAVGVGGGIFLSPLFLLARWAGPKETAAVSAAFIWLNSASGMWGHWQTGAALPEGLWRWASAAALGGWVGSHYGARRWPGSTLRRVLATVLLVAAAKNFLAL